MTKYHAKPVIVTEDGTMFEVAELKRYNITDITGTRFDSKAEAQYYLRLKQLQKAGEVETIELQPAYVLQENPKITYKADFLVTMAGEKSVVDVKGFLTKEFRLKAKMFVAKYPELPLILVKQRGRSWEFKRFGA
jgi:predicted nuclease of restriction endonuclease-like RecB superfamily